MSQLPVIQPSSTQPPAAPAETAGMTIDPARTEALKPAVIDALRQVFDPEIPVNIYELGLVYEIFADASDVVGIRMTLTAPACPAAQFLPAEVKKRVADVPGVSDVRVDVVWDPPWDRDRMSEAARLQLGLF